MSQKPTRTSDQHTLSRRLLLASSGAAAAYGLTQAMASPADAAAGTTAWKLGGNPNVNTDGTNFLGPTNVAPIVFKTKPSGTGALTERMRITPAGRVGINTTNPAARAECVSADVPTALQGTSNYATSAAVGVQGVGDNGVGVQGNSATNAGVAGTGGYVGTRGQGGSYGVIGSANSVGVYGSGSDYGLYGVGGEYGAYTNGTIYGLYGSGPTG